LKCPKEVRQRQICNHSLSFLTGLGWPALACAPSGQVDCPIVGGGDLGPACPHRTRRVSLVEQKPKFGSKVAIITISQQVAGDSMTSSVTVLGHFAFVHREANPPPFQISMCLGASVPPQNKYMRLLKPND
jgi:hypothetical protein